MKLAGVVRNIFEAMFDAVLPLRARAARTKSRTIEDIPLCPTVHELMRAHITTLMDYQNPAVQDLVRSLKYDGSRYAARLAASIVADYLREEIAAARTFSQAPILLIPIPLHPTRARERGWNQIELVLSALPQEFRDGTLASVETNALSRIRVTAPQTKLHRSDRLSNVAGAFGVVNKVLVRKAKIFLMDDVTTTGATLIHAAIPLKRAGADVILLALARA